MRRRMQHPNRPFYLNVEGDRLYFLIDPLVHYMTEPHKRFSLKYIIIAEDISSGKVGKNERFGRLFDRRGFGDVKKFFSRRRNVETSFFSPKTTRYVYREYAPTFNSRRTYRPETLQRWVVSRMAVGVSSPHSTIRSRLHSFFKKIHSLSS